MVQAGTELQCPLHFDPQPRTALLLRLTPQMRNALAEAASSGQPASIRLSNGAGSPTVITVGSQTFDVVTNDEGNCELMRLPSAAGAAATEVGVIKQKLFVKRNLEEERLRVRQRGQQADEQLHMRKSVLLGSDRPPPAAMKHKSVVSRSFTPPVGHKEAHGRSHSPAPAFEPRKSQSPAVAAQAAAPAGAAKKGHGKTAKSKLGVSRPASAAKAGATAKANGAAKASSTARANGSAAAAAAAAAAADVGPTVVAAARKGGLRLCLIALLAIRPRKKEGVEKALAEVAKALPGFKPGDHRITLGLIADKKSPGIWYLRSQAKKELEGINLDEIPAAAASPANAAPMAKAQAKAVAQPKAAAASTPVDASEAAAQPRAVAAQQGSQKAASKQQAAGEGPAKKRRKRNAAEASAEATPAQQQQPSTSPAAPAPVQRAKPIITGPPGKPIITGPPGKPSVAYEQPPQPLHEAGTAPAAARQQRQQSPPPQAAAAGPEATASWAAHLQQAGEAAGRGASPVAAPATFRPSSASPTLSPSPSCAAARRAIGGSGSGPSGGRSSGRSSSGLTSRSSGAYDESWFAEHVSRQPSLQPPIQTAEEFAAARSTFNAKHEVFFRLHQEIQAHKRDLEGLRRAVETAEAAAERERWQAQLVRLFERRRERAGRWDAAHDTLKVELNSIKEEMLRFRCARQPAPQPPSSGGQPIRAQ